MRKEACYPTIPLVMGTVSGPVFGLFDISDLKEHSFCQIDLLRKVRVGLIKLSQVIVLMRPEQVKKHQCSRNGCRFSQFDFSSLPEVDYICRAWFPNEDCDYDRWPEASISIGGAMLAAFFLRKKSIESNNPQKFAFWSSSTSTWEVLSADIETGQNVYATIHRTNFNPPENIHSLSKNTIPYSGIGQIVNDLSDILNSSSNQPEGFVNDLFTTIVIHERKKKGNVKKILDVDYSLIPFLPLFVGELQNVVLVGDFLRVKLLTKYRSEISSLEPYSKFLGKLRYILERKETREKILKHFGVVNSWKQEEILNDYPLKDAKCGWTFFNDEIKPDNRISGFPFQYLTIEPGVTSPPFGNSASGALACAIAQSIIHPNAPLAEKKFRGITHNSERPYGERIFASSAPSHGKFLSVQKNANNLWTIHGRIEECGYYLYDL